MKLKLLFTAAQRAARKLVCRALGHVWGRARRAPARTLALNGSTGRRVCGRCGAVKAVTLKRYAPRAVPPTPAEDSGDGV